MARDPPPKYVLYGMIGVAIVAIIAILVVFIMSNRAPTNVPNGGTCTSDKQCLSKYCNKTDPVNPVCDCAPDGTACDSTVSCCGTCKDGKCYSDPGVTWISVPGYNVSSSGIGQISADDETTCETKCGENCIGISYFNDEKTCTLVNSLPTNNFYNDGVTTYMKKTSNKITIPGTFVGQTSAGTYNDKTLDECSSLCTDSCVAYSYDSSTNKCWLANDLNLFGVGSKDTNITTYIL